MSKDVIIPGVIVFACLALVVIAFVPMHNNKKVPKIDTPSVTDTSNGPGTLDSQGGDQPTHGDTPQDGLTPPAVITGPGNQVGAVGNASPNTPVNPPNPFNNPIQSNQAPFTPSHPAGQGLGSPLPPAVPVPPIEQPIQTPAPPAADEPQVHVVVSGETLGEISMHYYGTSKNWKKIAEANKVDPSELEVGQKLTIPVIAGTKKEGDAPTAPTELAAGERAYKVKAGDSYYSIAKHELGNAARWKEIAKLNHTTAEELHAGQTIKLPAKASEAVGPETPPAPVGETGTGSGRVHVVVAGDTLASISHQYFGTTTKWKAIVKANPGVDPSALKVGQKLVIPEGPTTSPGAAQTGSPGTTGTIDISNSGNDGSSSEYVVKAGDTLATIAASQLGSRKDWKRIVDINPGVDSSHLRIGQKLKIPAKPGAASPTSAPPTSPTAPAFPSPATGNGNGFGPTPGTGFPNGAGSSGNGFSPPAANRFENTPSPAGNGFAPPATIPPLAAPTYPSPSGTPGSSPGAGTTPGLPGPSEPITPAPRPAPNF